MTNDEAWEVWEAHWRKHTLNGQVRELHDASALLGRLIVQRIAQLLLKILNALGM
jgi:hypothetical protein